jgi:hypothetical protein
MPIIVLLIVGQDTNLVWIQMLSQHAIVTPVVHLRQVLMTGAIRLMMYVQHQSTCPQ